MTQDLKARLLNIKKDHDNINELASDLGEPRLLHARLNSRLNSGLDAEGCLAEATEMSLAQLQGCGVAQGALEVVSYEELSTGGVFEELQGVSRLKVSTAGALSALLHRAEAGERLGCALELSDELKIGEGALRSLLKSELLEAVCEALTPRDIRHELSEESLTALLGDELTAAHIGDELVMKARFIAERVEVLQLSKLNPMVLCPAGEFWMGSEEGVGCDFERPRHRVKISEPFLMGQTQVTQALWQAVMGKNPSKFQRKGSDFPVEKVTWFDMVRFCNRLSELESLRPAYVVGAGYNPTVYLDLSANGYRLPTEAEWEYAAKAGTELMYAGSANVEEVAWCEVTSKYRGTRPVATKKPNAWGLYDMSGNVWEWCNDPWDRDVYKSRQPQAEVSCDPCPYVSAPVERAFRGGGWYEDVDSCRVAYRSGNDAGSRGFSLGGRLLRSHLNR